ncbi:50S ribosomal protein L5 [Candidatus Dependentiae bacterium Noda2021]|nr:50S ribosomal protein L5 [Candidatus Dependentiae bacterium Noda2021]
MAKARLEEIYNSEIRSQLMTKLGLSNVMEIPKLEKIVLNVGVGKDAVSDSKVFDPVIKALTQIAGQAPVKTLARTSIAGFKLRKGMPLGVRVTLRKQRMYEFLDRLINLALPKVRDFQGVPTKFDGRGNYNLGIKEWIIFPEISYEIAEKVYGLNVTICTSAKSDEHGLELLKSFGMPFRRA